MALSATVAAAPTRPSMRLALDAVRGLSDVALRSFASLVFSRSRRVGAVMLLAVATAPTALAWGLAAVLVSVLTARALKLAPDRVESGALSYNALMVGLALAALAPPSLGSLALLVMASALSVLASSSLDLAMRVTHSLPVLTLPFLVAYYLALGAAPVGSALVAPPADALSDALSPGLLREWVRELGALVCAPRVEAGALIFMAIALHSRIAAALSLAGFALAFKLTQTLVGPESHLASTAGLNGMLVAIAVGAVWFIPSAWSYLVGLGAAAVSVLVTVGVASRFERVGVPVLIVPFNLTVPLVLYVMRQRVADGRPHSIDFAPGTPEQNLTYFRSRNERFGSVGGVRFSAPFRGSWTCTQGVSGGITHEGPWRHAFDFEVFDDEGRAFRDVGASLDDYHCFKLPVVAPAAGVIAKVIDGIADNAVGAVNTDDNWGNVVIVYHAPGLYSCLAHLSPGSIVVGEGQPVAAGEVLARCGNSGRSATPHLHMQLQATATVGEATLPIELHDVVLRSRGVTEAHAACVPSRGDSVRRVDRDDERAAMLRFEYGVVTRAHLDARRGARHEDLVADIDLLGRFLLRAKGSDATLYYESGATQFTVHDVTGDASSVLHLVRAALSRVPFDAEEPLVWRDRLPLRGLLPAWQRPLFDLASPFGGAASLVMRYRARRAGDALVIEGTSERNYGSAPWVRTSATLSARGGIAQLAVTVRGRERHIVFERAPVDTALARDASRTASTSTGGHHAQAQV